MVKCKDTYRRTISANLLIWYKIWKRLVTKVTDLAERANVVLASKDAIIYPDAEEYYLYSNQWIPLMENCTIREKVRLGSILDKMCGGGFQVTAGFRPVAN